MHNVFFPSLREFRMKISSQKGERHFTSLKVKKEKCKKTCFKTSPYRSGEIADDNCVIWVLHLVPSGLWRITKVSY